MNNTTVRSTAAQEHVKLWEIAHKLGITDSTFSRKLRYELPAHERERILTIIEPKQVRCIIFPWWA